MKAGGRILLTINHLPVPVALRLDGSRPQPVPSIALPRVYGGVGMMPGVSINRPPTIRPSGRDLPEEIRLVVWRMGTRTSQLAKRVLGVDPLKVSPQYGGERDD